MYRYCWCSLDATKIQTTKLTYFGEFCYLKISWIRKIITLMFMSSSRKKFTLLYQNSGTDVFVGFRPPYVGAHPSGHQHGVSIQISINLGKTFLRISRIRNILQTWKFHSDGEKMRNTRGQQGENELKKVKVNRNIGNKMFGEQTQQFLHKD